MTAEEIHRDPVPAGGSNSSPSPGPGPGKLDSNIIGGTKTTDRPEIGKLNLPSGGFCTATLVASRLLVTAAHCYNYQSDKVDTQRGTFEMTSSSGTVTQRDVVRVHSFGNALGSNDVAIGLLDWAVPWWQPRAVIAFNEPIPGQVFKQYGLGCIARANSCNDPPPTSDGSKRVIDIQFGDQAVNCPGDSGGPLLLNNMANGPYRVFGVASGYWCNTGGGDLWGNVVQRFGDIEAVLRHWNVCDDLKSFQIANCDRVQCSRGSACSGGLRACTSAPLVFQIGPFNDNSNCLHKCGEASTCTLGVLKCLGGSTTASTPLKCEDNSAQAFRCSCTVTPAQKPTGLLDDN